MNLKTCVLGLAMTVTACVPVAMAHAHPKVMLPAADSAGPAPAKVVVTFSEPVEAKFSSLALTDEKGATVGTEKSAGVAGDPKTLTLEVPKLTPGDYLVHWVSVAPDGHKMQGEYKFTVK
ncbi:copper resistance protein CopC [Terriglobus albidus]|uniref:Copper resistance protein CopC n=1 Tax=Terriglobus albidus TaxID=1592106 RepID=A0A5B9EAD7_9BACT|nr:copper resistance protein CopC [Terriglobus albidus]QEE29113.1 copper resistance protein CopC [Terriglobus albidus]